MIVLFTDFGFDDIYVGQIKAALLRHGAGGTPIVELLNNVPAYQVRAGAHLLAALRASFPPGVVFFAVVDPGVGSDRKAVVLEADGQWFVGPDNGLLSVVAARASIASTWQITWRPQYSALSFHGRDLFAPIAARIASGHFPADQLQALPGLDIQFGPDDIAQVVYIDHYGNAITGLRACGVPQSVAIQIGQLVVSYAPVFSGVPAGVAFWYENSVGLVEIAVNQGSAAAQLGLNVGDTIMLIGYQ